MEARNEGVRNVTANLPLKKQTNKTNNPQQKKTQHTHIAYGNSL